MFDKVIQELKAKLFFENNNKITTKLNFNNDEELENVLLHSNNQANKQIEN